MRFSSLEINKRQATLRSAGFYTARANTSLFFNLCCLRRDSVLWSGGSGIYHARACLNDVNKTSLYSSGIYARFEVASHSPPCVLLSYLTVCETSSVLDHSRDVCVGGGWKISGKGWKGDSVRLEGQSSEEVELVWN